MNSEVFARNPAGLREHFLEILGVQQPAYGAHGQESATGATTALADRSDRQALAPLGPTCVDDRTPTTGLHASPKPVGTCTADLGGLIGAFHDLWRPTEGPARMTGTRYAGSNLGFSS